MATMKGVRSTGAAALRCSTAVAAALAVAGCAPLGEIRNTEPVAEGRSYQAQYRAPEDRVVAEAAWTSREANLGRCAAPGTLARTVAARPASAGDVELLSPGDLLDVAVGSDDAFSGSYKVSQDGTIKLRHLPPIPASGRSAEAAEAAIDRALVATGAYRVSPKVSVRVTDFASARVFVSGAVFAPGEVTVGGVDGKDVDAARERALGGTAETRRLSRALQSAGGVRPDADLSAIVIHRRGATLTVDARPALAGGAYANVVLLAGDRVEVRSRGCFQEELMVPSPVSPPGAMVFMSNLTVPASANALSAVGKDARQLAYGTRMSQALFGMNCVGGTKLTNADRSAILATRNPITGRSVVIERRIEDLLRRSDRDDYDPFILPNDALACYDSAGVNAIQVLQVLAPLATPAAILK